MDMPTSAVWATEEFMYADLGDIRRNTRLSRVACGTLCDLGVAISSSCGGNGAQAVSRLFDCDDVTEGSILGGHRVKILERCESTTGRILVAQDTTTLSFAGRHNIEGLGPITSCDGNGMLMHSAFVVNESKVPLGVLDIKMWCRIKGSADFAQDNPIEKESQKWLWGLERTSQAFGGFDKEVVLIGDRESDMYDLFIKERPSNIHILVRMSQNRLVDVDDECKKLYDVLDSSPKLGCYELLVADENRIASILVRSSQVLVKAPKNRKLSNEPSSVTLWAVEALEINAPDPKNAIHWRLLTTLDCACLDSCLYVIKCYSARWSIEEFHRTLKTGCNVEKLQLEKISRMRPAIALLAVVAQQVMYLTKYARESPDLPAECISSQEERDTVQDWVETHRFKTYEIISVKDYVRGIGFIGGFRGRKHDGEPGVQSVWKGLRLLSTLITGRRLERRRNDRSHL